MKQTAVEYLFNELWNTDKDKLMWHSILDKAKEMERLHIEEEKEKSYTNGRLAQIEIRNNFLNTWDPSDGIEDPEEMK